MESKVKIVIIGKVWPEPTSSAAGTRMLQLIDLLKQVSLDIIFVSTAQESIHSVNVEKLGIKKATIQLNDASFDEWIEQQNPSIVLYDRFMTEEQFGWRVREKCPDALTLLDTEDLHFLRHARQEAVKNDISLEDANLYSEATKRELASILRCDYTLMISQYELQLLAEQFNVPTAKLHYLPLYFKHSKSHLSEIPFEERNDVVFIGNFLHEPNWDAAKQLKKIWKEVGRKLPEAQLLLYGAYPSQRVWDLHSTKERFIVKGRADVAMDVIAQARLLVAPLRFGAGLKGKLLEAMYVGTPSVTTSVGSEGIVENTNWPGVVEDDLNKFGDAMIRLYGDRDAWEKHSRVGYDILASSFLKEQHQEKFHQCINLWIKNVQEHRQRFFIGEVLHHHTLHSTRYLSKWIEEKNAKSEGE